MRCFNKTLIAFLLIVAIPVQGFAATAMGMCATNHHSGAVTAQATHHHAPNQKQAHAQAHSHAHSHANQHAAQMHHELVSNEQVVATSTSDLGHGKCSACASCCVALAIVSQLPVAQNASAPTLAIPFVAATFSNHISDGLDPPPRSNLA